jgi:hypothetical protein
VESKGLSCSSLPGPRVSLDGPFVKRFTFKLNPLNKGAMTTRLSALRNVLPRVGLALALAVFNLRWAAAEEISFSGQGQSSTSIGWTWTAVGNVQEYHVQNEAGVSISGALPLGTLSWTETGLSPGTTHSRRVAAVQNNGNVVHSAYAQASTFADLTAPSNFSGQAQNESTVLWTWSNVDGETGFRIEDEGKTNLSGDLDADTLSWTESGLSPGTSYTRRVVAFNATQSAASGLATATTPTPPPPALAAPANFSGQAQNQTTIVWAWSDVDGETGFRIEDEGRTNLSGDLAADTLSWTESGLSPGNSYTRRVVAFNATQTAGSSFATAATPVPVLSAPANLSGQAQSPSSLRWAWSNVENETGFRVLDEAGRNLSGDLPADTLSWTETGLPPNANRTRRVAVFNAFETKESGPASRFTLSASPASPLIDRVSYFFADLSWSANGNPPGTAYQAEVTAVGKPTVFQTVTATSATFSGLAEGTSYSFRVRSVNGDGVVNPAEATLAFATPLSTVVSVQVHPSSGAVVDYSMEGADLTILVPVGAFSEPVTMTVRVPPAPPEQPVNELQMRKTGLAFEISLDKPAQPSRPIRLTLAYDEPFFKKFDERRLIVGRYDEERRRWIALKSTLEPGQNRLAADTDHLSVFEIMQAAPSFSVSDAVAYPNPFRPSQGHDKVSFANLPAYARIRIYTPLGELVEEFSADFNGTFEWDATNRAGEKVASGVYFALAEGTGGKHRLKVIVQR